CTPARHRLGPKYPRGRGRRSWLGVRRVVRRWPADSRRRRTPRRCPCVCWRSFGSLAFAGAEPAVVGWLAAVVAAFGGGGDAGGASGCPLVVGSPGVGAGSAGWR